MMQTLHASHSLSMVLTVQAQEAIQPIFSTIGQLNFTCMALTYCKC